jgi:hypothetical protein
MWVFLWALAHVLAQSWRDSDTRGASGPGSVVTGLRLRSCSESCQSFPRPVPVVASVKDTPRRLFQGAAGLAVHVAPPVRRIVSLPGCGASATGLAPHTLDFLTS